MRKPVVKRGRFETLEVRLVLSAASLADISLIAHGAWEEGGCNCGCCATCTGGNSHHDHDDHLHGVDPYGNEYHAIPLVDYDRLELNNYPDLNRPVQLEGLANTFHLHSNPGATKKVFLDFTGYTTSGTYWNSSFNGGADIVTAAYDFDGSASFSDTELQRIQRIWQRVAEDFAPFDVDVTTADPGADDLRNSGGADDEWGIRVVIGGNGSWYGSAGGVAYLTSFTWGSDTPVFVFEDNLANGHERYTAEAISHEVGHALGLSHDGTSSVGYYTGHGTGETSWAPIMGVGYYEQLTQWSRGEYNDANNSQDDLAMIVGNNGFGYKADDHGNTGAAASLLATSGMNVSSTGIIEQNTDVDVFAFSTTGGDVNLSFDEAAIGANLDMRVDLYNGSNQLIASSNPTEELGASLNLNLAAGDYTVHITGVGKGDPLAVGYSDYGSLGQYTVSGTVEGLVDVAAIQHAAMHNATGFPATPGNDGQVSSGMRLQQGSVTNRVGEFRVERIGSHIPLHLAQQANSTNDLFHPYAQQSVFRTAGESESVTLVWDSDGECDKENSQSTDMIWSDWNPFEF